VQMKSTTNVKMTSDYAAHSTSQKSMNDYCAPMFPEIIRQMEAKDPSRFERIEEPFVIADLGCANGKNSVIIYKSIITTVRDISPAMPIIIYLNDTINSDFSSAFATCSKELHGIDQLFVYAVGKSFYERLLPNNTADLIFSFLAMHWLSHAPCTLDNFLFFATTNSMNTESEKNWMTQGSQDWLKFITHRAKELKPNGILIAGTFGTHTKLTIEDKKFISACADWQEALRITLKKHNLSHMQRSLTLPHIARQKEHYYQPFVDGLTKLKIKLFEEFDLADEITQQFIKTNDSNILASRYANFVKTFSRPFYEGSLKEEGLEHEKIKEVLDDYFEQELPAIIKAKASEGYNYETRTYVMIVIEK